MKLVEISMSECEVSTFVSIITAEEESDATATVLTFT